MDMFMIYIYENLQRSPEFLRQCLSNMTGSRTIAAVVLILDIALTVYFLINPSNGNQRGGTVKFDGGFLCHILRTILMLTMVALVISQGGYESNEADMSLDCGILSRIEGSDVGTILKEDLVSESLETHENIITEVCETCKTSDTYDDSEMQKEWQFELSSVYVINNKGVLNEIELSSDDATDGSEEFINSETIQENCSLSSSVKTETYFHEQTFCQKRTDTMEDVCHLNPVLSGDSPKPLESYSDYKKECSLKERMRDLNYGRLPGRCFSRSIEARPVLLSSSDNQLCDILEYMRQPHSVTSEHETGVSDDEYSISVEETRQMIETNHQQDQGVQFGDTESNRLPWLPISSDPPDEIAGHSLRSDNRISYLHDSDQMVVPAARDMSDHQIGLLAWNQARVQIETRATRVVGGSNLVHNSEANCMQEEVTSGISLSQDSEFEAALRRQYTCVVCLDTRRTIVFMPCSHLVCCNSCADMVSKCPVCRASIDKKQRVHYS